MATGGRALGRLQVEEGDALYLALEDHPRRLQERLRKVLNGGEPPKRLTVEVSCPPLPLAAVASSAPGSRTTPGPGW